MKVHFSLTSCSKTSNSHLPLDKKYLLKTESLFSLEKVIYFTYLPNVVHQFGSRSHVQTYI